MKRILFFLMTVIAISSCGAAINTTAYESPLINLPKNGAKIINSATYQQLNYQPYVTPVQVDLKVSPEKISYSMAVTKTIRMGGYDNVVATAVKEALEAHGSGDVLVGIQTQVKYNDAGEIESISITGFPASYINFRSNDTLLPIMTSSPTAPSTETRK